MTMGLFAVVAALALVQSLFGVGLLLIGTPLLLLAGLPFIETLWILLPASLTVSSLQLILDGRGDRTTITPFAWFAMPALVVGLVIALTIPAQRDITPAVAVMLAVAALLRLIPRLASRVRSIARRHEPLLLAAIGLIHGLTNMGGSLLLDFAAARHSDKLALRQHVALGYVMFASLQLLVLSVISGPRVGWATGVYCGLAGLTYMGVGRRGFQALSQPYYNVMLSVFMLMVAAWLGWRSL